MKKDERVKSSHIIPRVYIKNFTFDDIKHPQNKESVLVAYKGNFNKWIQKGFGKKSIFTQNGIYDFSVIPEEKQTVEIKLGEFEGRIGKIIPKLEKNISLTVDEYLDLSVFIFSLMNRTREKMEGINSFLKQIHDCFEGFDLYENKEYTKDFFYGYEDFAKLWILKTKKLINKSNLLNESFYFLYNNTDTPFITSDNPVISEFISRNEIEGIFSLPVIDNVKIDRKCFLLPLTPKISVLYCDFLDKAKLPQNIITLLDSNIVFKMNMLQLRNCSEFIFSHIDNSNIDYAKAYEDWCNINNTDKLIFITEQNKYFIKGMIIKQDIFSAIIQIDDIAMYESINEKIIQIQDYNNTFMMRASSINEVKRTTENMVIEVKII